MPGLDEAQSPKERAIERIAIEIARADESRVPTSRQKLTQLVFAEFGIPLPEATVIVDEYCDENARGVPFYLQDELESPFLKVSAVTTSVLGIGVLWYGSNRWHQQKPSWFLFVLGAILIGSAGYSWFKTIQRELAKH